jgi:hypothetical protein
MNHYNHAKPVNAADNTVEINYKILGMLSRRFYNIKIDTKSFESVEEFKYLGTTLTNRNSIHEEIQSRLTSGNACYHSVQNLLSSRLLSKNTKVRVHRTVVLPVVLYGCETLSHTEGGTKTEGVRE